MARQTKSTSNTASSAASTEVATDPTQETIVTTTAPEETTTDPALMVTVPADATDPATANPPKVVAPDTSVADLAAFALTVAAAVDGASEDGTPVGVTLDESGAKAVGVEPESPAAAVRDAFLKITGKKHRDTARDTLTDGARDALMVSASPTRARAFLFLQAVLDIAAPKVKKDAAPVDPTEAIGTLQASLSIAYQLATVLPEGVDGTAVEAKRAELVSAVTTEQIQAYVAYLDLPKADRDAVTEENTPKLPAYAVNAIRIATVKKAAGRPAGSTNSPRSYTGPQRSIAKHISEVMGASDGFVAMKELVSTVSSEYPDVNDRPSSGAINNSLFAADGSAKPAGDRGYVGTTDPSKGAKLV